MGAFTCLFADLSRNLGAVLPRHVLAVHLRRPLRRSRQWVRAVLRLVLQPLPRLGRREVTETSLRQLRPFEFPAKLQIRTFLPALEEGRRRCRPRLLEHPRLRERRLGRLYEGVQPGVVRPSEHRVGVPLDDLGAVPNPPAAEQCYATKQDLIRKGISSVLHSRIKSYKSVRRPLKLIGGF